MPKQLTLFKNKPNLVEPLCIELHNYIYAFKSFALQLEMALGNSHKSFLYCREVSRLISLLGSIVGPDTKTYRGLTREGWMKKASYEPYYSLVETRTPESLYRTAMDYNSRLKRLILRLEAIHLKGDQRAEELVSDILLTSHKMVRSLYNEKFEL